MTEITSSGLSAHADEYLARVQAVLAAAVHDERVGISEAGSLLAERFSNDGLLYIFGSGHSHVFGEEGFYRAGGSARICPILVPDYMLHVSAVHSTELERENGHAEDILAGYELNPGTDAMLVVSNSGANALPVEVAQAAAARGLPVIGITSVAYASSSSRPGPRLHDIADIVLDNHCPPGDALILLQDGLPRVGPGSTIVGLTLLNAIIVDSLAKQVAASVVPDIYVSAGLPNVAAHNAALASRFAPRIPHL